MADTPGFLSNAELAAAVQEQTDTVKVFKDQQVTVFTSSASTAVVTDAEGVQHDVPTWPAINAGVTGIDIMVRAGREVNVLDFFPVTTGGQALINTLQTTQGAPYGSLDVYVQAAVAFLNSLPFGGVLYFPRGTWNLVKGIYLTHSNCYIRGDGMQSTVLRFNDNDTGDAVRIASATWAAGTHSTATRLQYVGLCELTITGRGGANGFANRVGLRLGGCGFEGTLRHVELHGWGGNALVGEDAWDWNVFGCKFTSNGNNQVAGTTYPRAVSLRALTDNSNAIKFVGCHWEGNAAGSLDIGGASNAIHVTNCKMEGNGSIATTAFDDIYIEGGGCVFSNNFVSRDQFQSYWMYVKGKANIVHGNSLRAPADSRGSPWFKVDPVTDGSVAMQLRIANNTIFGKGDLGQFVFDLRGNVKMHNNDIRLMNGLKSFNVGATGCEIQFNNVVQVGNIGLNSAYMFTLTDGGVFIIDNNTFSGNAYATVGADGTLLTVAASRLTGRVEFTRMGSANNSSVSVSADGLDTYGYGEGWVFALTGTTQITQIKQDRIGKRVTLFVPSTSGVNTGGNIKLGNATAKRSGGWLTLQQVLFSGNTGWQEVSWVPIAA